MRTEITNIRNQSRSWEAKYNSLSKENQEIQKEYKMLKKKKMVLFYEKGVWVVEDKWIGVCKGGYLMGVGKGGWCR